MRLKRFDAAASDYAHLLQMQTILHGEGSIKLVTTCEKLGKAHVFMRSWEGARAALSVAHGIVSKAHGPHHHETIRLGDVLLSLEQYAARRALFGFNPLAMLTPVPSWLGEVGLSVALTRCLPSR
jgi:hypothetical protein